MASQNNNVAGSGYGSPYIDALVWGCKWTGPGPIKYFFFNGDGSEDIHSFTPAAKAAFREVTDLYESVCGVKFAQAASLQATDVAWFAAGNAFLGQGVLGVHDVPDGQVGIVPESGQTRTGIFNVQSATWQQGINAGGDGFHTILHELGHGVGLAHPHDGGSELDWSTFPGVPRGSAGALGDGAQNQGVYSVMSYNPGYDVTGSGLSWGHAKTLMALDVAALQRLYGATAAQTGGDTYDLATANVTGTGWACIWDTGGADAIRATTATARCTINLNDAPLVGLDAGGFVSHVDGVAGGFTIANGVTIEQAWGGSAGDDLIGNEAANLIVGGGGNDSIAGGAGFDTFAYGRQDGNGADLIWDFETGDKVDLRKAAGSHTVVNGLGTTTVELSDGSFISTLNGHLWDEGDFLAGAPANPPPGGANVVTGTARNDSIEGTAGPDTLIGLGGNDEYTVNHPLDRIVEAAGEGVDSAVVTGIAKKGILADNVENLSLALSSLAKVATGNDLSNRLVGNGLANKITGNGGFDDLLGLGGKDKLTGGFGADDFVYLALSDSFRKEGQDTILGFNVAQGDRLDLEQIDANTATGIDDAFAFVGTADFTGTAGELRFDNGLLQGDVDGDALTDLQVKLGRIILTEEVILL